MESGESIDLIDSEVVMFYLYVQFSSASRQPKISNLMFFANPIDRLPSHPSALHLETFQWQGRTRSWINSIFLFEIDQFSLENILTLLE